jgi:hypothetical protein
LCGSTPIVNITASFDQLQWDATAGRPESS